MPTSDFNFANEAGRQLSGALETAAGQPKAYAIFAIASPAAKLALLATGLIVTLT